MAEDFWKILIVDDDEFSRTLVQRQLAAEGYDNFVFAHDGKQALEILSRESIDLLLLDLEMPEIDGVAVLREVKSNLNLHRLPVIVISGIDDLDRVAECIEMGAEDYLHKPFNATLLKARLKSTLEKKRLNTLEATHLNNLRAEKQHSEALLEVILPGPAARELKATGTVQPRSYDDVVLLFCDVVEFTSFCSTHSAGEVIERLQALFSCFEDITNAHNLEKIKTIGDEFMVVGGLSKSNHDPLRSAIQCGIEMINRTGGVCPDWKVRVGVADGPVIAGIVGKDKYQFDVWGDTVNLASRMTSLGTPGAVTMTHDCWLRAGDAYVGRMRGELEVKGKGLISVVECTGLKEPRPADIPQTAERAD